MLTLPFLLSLFSLRFNPSLSQCSNTPIDLNTASISELDSLPYITSTSAQLIVDFRPICSPFELTYSPKKISGITSNRVTNNWKYSNTQSCETTCCRAIASCNTPAPTSSSINYSYNWITTSWSDCSAECNSGTQEREVTCQQTLDSVTTTVDDAYCESDISISGNKPLSKQICNTQECPNYEWITTEWSGCVYNNVGNNCEQNRNVTCYETTTAMEVDDNQCDNSDTTKPDNSQSCDNCQRAATASAAVIETTNNNDVQYVQLDILQSYNHEKCNTDNYYNLPSGSSNGMLIIRRGCNPDLWVFVKRGTVDGDTQELSANNFNVSVRMEKDLIEGDEDDMDNYEDASDVWNGYITWETYNVTSGWLTFDIDAEDAPIGKFIVNLQFKDHGETDDDLESFANITVYILFNPYSTKDDVYMSNTQFRKEYVENTQGLIWQGLSDDNTAFLWKFDQYNYTNLEIAMNTLKRLSLEYRNNIVLISRQMSYGIGADICYGKWGSGSYTSGRPSGGYYCSKTKNNCRDPSSWTGTSQLFDVYRSVLSPVQYCQCFVYAGVFTTIGRSVGIPTRPVSTFQSAHDTNYNRAIEKYYIFDEETGAYDPTTEGTDNSDSIWSFHVWNEMWFDRDDFDQSILSSYDVSGWQAVDATPQEFSIGGNPGVGASELVYQLGPASINLVKNNINAGCKSESYTQNMGARYGCYDTEFVISEVNSNFNFFYKRGTDATEWILYDSFFTDPWGDDFGTIGLQISTKKPKTSISANCLSESVSDCSSDLLEVTDNYKQPEASGPGTPTNDTYSWKAGDTYPVSSRRRRRILRKDFNYHNVNNNYNNNRQLLWQQVEWSNINTTNDTDIYDTQGIEYELLTFPPQWYYSPMIVTDTNLEYLYGEDYSYSYFGVGINSFEDVNLTAFCSITIQAQDYSGEILYLNNDTNQTIVKRDMQSFILTPGGYEECIFDLKYEEYLEWINDDLDISSKPYAFEFIFSVTFFDDEIINDIVNVSDVYDSIIERRKITVCTPLYNLRDRVICENGLRWFEPQYDLEYECDNSDELDINALGDGFCDNVNNIANCFDMGDCCKSTCVPSDEYNCDYFDCIDSRTIGFSYYTCTNLTGFINYINNVAGTGGDCETAVTINDFTCNDNIWFANSDNTCVNEIISADGTYGEFETCVNDTWNSLSNNAQNSISVILDCIEMLDTTDDTYIPGNDTWTTDDDDDIAVRYSAQGASYVITFIGFVFVMCALS